MSKECKSCGAQNFDSATRCSRCDEELMTPPSQPQLLPCPFCGCNAQFATMGVMCSSVTCRNNSSFSVADWNTRATLPAITPSAQLPPCDHDECPPTHCKQSIAPPSPDSLEKAIEKHIDERHEWIRALVYTLRYFSDGKTSFEDDVMTVDAHFEDHVLLKTVLFEQLLTTAKQSRELLQDAELSERHRYDLIKERNSLQEQSRTQRALIEKLVTTLKLCNSVGQQSHIQLRLEEVLSLAHKEGFGQGKEKG